MSRIVVCGGGGFIGGHLVSSLLEDGHHVVAIDSKPFPEWHQLTSGSQDVLADLRSLDAALTWLKGADQVFNLAADMGGIGFIETHKVECMLSVEVSANVLKAARALEVERVFYSSSACVYAAEHQQSTDAKPLAEWMAYPAQPEDGYGWEKLFSERLHHHFAEDYGLDTRVARYHNIAGPHGTWHGGREKAPAALCRKVALAKLGGEAFVDVWGDGSQARSFCWVGDCVEGTKRLMASDCAVPVNIGSSELVTIDGLLDLIMETAGYHPMREYQLGAPRGVQGRNSDNTLCAQVLDWQPSTMLAEWLPLLYDWIEHQVREAQP